MHTHTNTHVHMHLSVYISVFLCVYEAAAAKLLQSCSTLCGSIDGSLPGSPVPGILQARTLDWVAISSSNAWKWKVKVKSLSGVRLFETPWTAAYQALPSMGLSRQEHWSGVPLPSHVWSREISLILCRKSAKVLGIFNTLCSTLNKIILCSYMHTLRNYCNCQPLSIYLYINICKYIHTYKIIYVI